jgi:hypothetical protein
MRGKLEIWLVYALIAGLLAANVVSIGGAIARLLGFMVY